MVVEHHFTMVVNSTTISSEGHYFFIVMFTSAPQISPLSYYSAHMQTYIQTYIHKIMFEILMFVHVGVWQHIERANVLNENYMGISEWINCGRVEE